MLYVGNVAAPPSSCQLFEASWLTPISVRVHPRLQLLCGLSMKSHGAPLWRGGHSWPPFPSQVRTNTLPFCFFWSFCINLLSFITESMPSFLLLQRKVTCILQSVQQGRSKVEGSETERKDGGGGGGEWHAAGWGGSEHQAVVLICKFSQMTQGLRLCLPSPLHLHIPTPRVPSRCLTLVGWETATHIRWAESPRFCRFSTSLRVQRGGKPTSAELGSNFFPKTFVIMSLWCFMAAIRRDVSVSRLFCLFFFNSSSATFWVLWILHVCCSWTSGVRI